MSDVPADPLVNIFPRDGAVKITYETLINGMWVPTSTSLQSGPAAIGECTFASLVQSGGRLVIERVRPPDAPNSPKPKLELVK